MQKAFLAASRANLVGQFGGRCGGAGAALVSVKMQNEPSSRVAWTGNNMAMKAGQLGEQAGEEPKGEGFWLGGRCSICPGVTIGDNSTIGAGAVVTKRVPANVIPARNSARVIRELAPPPYGDYPAHELVF